MATWSGPPVWAQQVSRTAQLKRPPGPAGHYFQVRSSAEPGLILEALHDSDRVFVQAPVGVHHRRRDLSAAHGRFDAIGTSTRQDEAEGTGRKVCFLPGVVRPDLRLNDRGGREPGAP